MSQKVFLLIVYFGVTFFISSNDAAMTEKQVAAAAKLVRNTCQPKHKATNEDIDKMHQGDWDSVEKTAKCYMFCVLMSNKLLNKENKLDYETSVSLAKTRLPASLRDSTLDSIEKCKDSVQTPNDKCIAAWELSKCMFMANPEKYFLP